AAAQEAISAYFQDEWEQMDEAMKTAFRESGSSPDQLKLRLKTLVSPWFRYFLNYDPAPTLQKVACPVLALNGEKDLQVPPKENLDAIAAALKAGGNKDFTVQELSGLNHLFQTAETGAPSEYAHIEETFAPSAMALISDWIRKEAAL
ncbi:MAG: prolyl oligopeptidase family serine peptidase, partial [Calditrichaeota bacterium]|nr:prolyl oligopeptidase family serine peptidase [Calditrichota bacterium]